jgi:hypothetical protein
MRRYDRLIRNLAIDASAEARRVQATCVWGVDATPLRSRYGLLTFRACIGAKCLQWVASRLSGPRLDFKFGNLLCWTDWPGSARSRRCMFKGIDDG